jgi:hypothetical protein
MDHEDAVRLKATERYLLNELDPDQRDQFEEHLFGCHECALDVRAAATFVEQTKNVLSEARRPVLVKAATPLRKGWLAWLRPAFAAPVMATLLAVIGYQNLVVLPEMKQANTPQVLPSASIDVAARSGTGPVVHARRGETFLLLVNFPGENRFSSYIADLYDPAGSIKCSIPISSEASNDTVPVRIPSQRESGVYSLAVRGILEDGSRSEIGRRPFELRFE